jgi:8-oxo-dGTP pyrophosphatase MutT (NUDIX family)
MEDLFNLGVKAIIRNGQGQMLVLRVSAKEMSNSKHFVGGITYDIPGGRVEVDDTIEGTLRKEVKEETNLELVDYKYLTTVFSPIRLKNQFVDSVGLILAIYEVQVKEGSINLNSESDSYEWVTPSEASTMFGDKYPQEFCEYLKNLD